MMLDFMGVYNTPYHQRPLQFLVEHADDSSEFSQEVIEDAKSRLEHIDYMVSRYPDYGKPVRRTSKD
jgi:hypothetical protein